MDIESFFERRLPSILVRNRKAVARIRTRCVFDIIGSHGGKWVVDFAADPPCVVLNSHAIGECGLELSEDDFLLILERPDQTPRLIHEGRIRINGSRDRIDVMLGVLFQVLQNETDKSRVDERYAAWARSIRDPRLIFMNHGYADGDPDEDCEWLSEDDQLWRYSINLVRHITEGVDLQGKRILDVGCGRGGTCSYIARYRHPRVVVGLDKCFEGVRFCVGRHTAENISFLSGDAQFLPFSDRSFDVVINIESSHLYGDICQFFAEVARVLSPRGMFCHTSIFTATSLEEIRDVLDSMPFRVVRMNDITPQVARALELNRPTFSALLGSMVASDMQNEGRVVDLIFGVNIDAYQKYISGRAFYYSWLLENLA